MKFETPELERRYALVIEGQCPHGHGPLERCDDHGWCPECRLGWSVRGSEWTLHFIPGRSIINGGSGSKTSFVPIGRWEHATDPVWQQAMADAQGHLRGTNEGGGE